MTVAGCNVMYVIIDDVTVLISMIISDYRV